MQMIILDCHQIFKYATQEIFILLIFLDEIEHFRHMRSFTHGSTSKLFGFSNVELRKLFIFHLK